ncbi:MAG: NAD(+)/NADH kinase [Campylobacterales bacterium]|nr:NAD(+)/NADH kinase [Campylobacterales bacterium]
MVDTGRTIEKIKTVGVSLRPYSPELKDYFQELKDYLKQMGIDTLIDESSASMIGVEGLSAETVFELSDYLISIGGDGTFISLARRSFKYQKPILAVNLGNLGFLTDVDSNEILKAVHRVNEGDYRIDQRMVIKVTTEIGGEENSFYAVNDIVIKHMFNKMTRINLKIDGVLANKYHGDALIISTPTGSTGYNLSAGGPVVFPYAKNFIFTPICPHSLTQRSLVLPVDFDIEFSVEEEDAILIGDGQDTVKFGNKDKIKISMSSKFVHVIHRKDRNFFNIVRDKLGWGDS